MFPDAIRIKTPIQICEINRCVYAISVTLLMIFLSRANILHNSNYFGYRLIDFVYNPFDFHFVNVTRSMPPSLLRRFVCVSNQNKNTEMLNLDHSFFTHWLVDESKDVTLSNLSLTFIVRYICLSDATPFTISPQISGTLHDCPFISIQYVRWRGERK